jgi:hypothetical protein
LVREFIADFRGLSGTAKQRAILDEIGAARMSLGSFFAEGGNKAGVAALLAAMQRLSKPVKPAELGVIGREHLGRRCAEAGAEQETFNYSKETGVSGGLPWIAEVAFAWCPKAGKRRLITGVNFSPGVANPFRALGTLGRSLDTILANQRANRDEPVITLVHLACPRLSFTDRGKTAVALGGIDDPEDEQEEDELDEEDDVA